MSRSDVILSESPTLRIFDEKTLRSYDYFDPNVGVITRNYLGSKMLNVRSSKVCSEIMVLMSIIGIAIVEALILVNTECMKAFVCLTSLINWLIPAILANMLFIYFMICIFYVLTRVFYFYLLLLPQNISRNQTLMTGIKMLKEYEV